MKKAACPTAIFLMALLLAPILAVGQEANKSEVYRVGVGVSPPKLLEAPDPKYSKQALEARYQGTVVLFVVVSAEGRPTEIRVQRSLGLGLDEEAVKAVRKWRFQPALKEGNPVAVQVNIEVNFRLPGGEKSHVLAMAAAGAPPASDAADGAVAAELIRENEMLLAATDVSSRPQAEVAKAYAELASLLAYTERHLEAVARYEEGLQRFPENPYLLNSAARYYLRARWADARDPKKAVAYAQNAVKNTNEREPTYLSTLGEALYADQQYDEAIAVIKKAIALVPGEPYYRSQLEEFERARQGR